MFLTHEATKSKLPAGFFAPGQHCWDSVSLDLWLQWFLATVEVFDETGQSTMSTLFLHRDYQLRELFECSNLKLIRFQAVKPCKEKEPGWRIEEVITIRQITFSDDEDILECETDKGSVFTAANFTDAESSNAKILQQKIVWRS